MSAIIQNYLAIKTLASINVTSLSYSYRVATAWICFLKDFSLHDYVKLKGNIALSFENLQINDDVT